MRRASLIGSIVVATLASLGAQAPRPGPFGQTASPPRDGPARPPAADSPITEPATMAGRVRHALEGQGLARVQITLQPADGGGVTVTTQTDAAGTYELTGLAPGRYTLHADRAGFVGLAYGQRSPGQPPIPIELAAGEALRQMDVALPPGSVVTGRVVDELGDPLPMATVRALRSRFVGSQRRLVTRGMDRTDDRGEYRIFGLEPGRYIVAASRPTLRASTTVAFRGPGPGARGTAFRGRRGAPDDQRDRPTDFAPAYFPAASRVSEASPLQLSLGQELTGIDILLRLVPTATLTGRVALPDGSPAAGARVLLVPDGELVETNHVARVQREGRFELHDVPPGAYTLRAIGGGGRGSTSFGGSLTGAIDVAVDGQDRSELQLTLSPGATISGRVESATATPVPMAPALRVLAEPTEATAFVRSGTTRVDRDGTFELTQVPAGPQRLRLAGLPAGWALESVWLDGRDIADQAVAFGAGAGREVRVVVTNRITRVAGSLQDPRGAPLTRFTVVAFPTDERRWTPPSRHVRAVRPDQHARYAIEGLPPGRYFLTAVEAIEDGEWHDPAVLRRLSQRSLRLSLAAGDTHDLDLEIDPDAR